ncbi:MAG: ABC transporter ATP-binding protein [Candidatus Bathyarchaeota archaeon]|nr:ABC transporter ATP-binding protein [Candidatus Bathyarchaeota archaeon]
MTEKEAELIVLTEKLSKIYPLGDAKIKVLNDINLQIPNAQFVVLCGPSGSGKTTLLNIIGGLDRATAGRIFVAGEDLTNKDEDFLSDFRCNCVGFVFQAYNLVSTLTVAENVAFPMEWTQKPPKHIQQSVEELLKTVGLEHRANHFPSQLSGGEQQRVAFARALANDPDLILADEPTGNLDAKNAQKIVQVLQLLKSEGKTVIVSTHDEQIRKLADQVLCLEDGKLASENEH